MWIECPHSGGKPHALQTLAREARRGRSFSHVPLEAMAGLAAFRVPGHWVDRVLSAGGTSRKLVILEVRQKVCFRRRVSIGFLVFQCPLLFRKVDLAQVVNAGIFLRSTARLDEVRDGDS